MTERENEAILAFKPPPLAVLRLWLAPARAWHRPSFIGVERGDPSRPTMFVGNHTLYGFQDVPHILFELYRVHGIFPRGLGDRAHFVVPVWRDLLTAFGCVNGTRENCSALMRAGQHVMVFPGGGREVFKRKNEAYRLMWKERIGFVQLAAAFGYRIVPFASLGADESLHIVLDARDIMSSPIGKLLKATGIADKHLRGGEELPPLVRGLGLTWIPQPEQFFVSFGPPISTSRYRRRTEDVAAMHELRAKAASSIEAHLGFLHRMRGGISGEQADVRAETLKWDKLVAGLETEVERAKRRLSSRGGRKWVAEHSDRGGAHREKDIVRRSPR
jgi:1-acyl-sn-glycerol-3-phosphate acyltransferase